MSKALFICWMLSLCSWVIPGGLFSQKGLYLQGPELNLTEEDPFIPGAIIVRFSPSVRAFMVGDALQLPAWQRVIAAVPNARLTPVFPQIGALGSDLRLPAGIERPDLSLIYYLHFDQAFPVDAVLHLLAEEPYIAYAEPWYIQRIFYQPNDPSFDTTNNRSGPYYLPLIKAREAWDIARNDPSILVGIIDNGTDGTHPDMIDNLYTNVDDPPDGIDNDKDGYVDNSQGWDFGGEVFLGPEDNDPDVGNVHGLWVAGNAAATADNNLGAAGTCFNCQYLPIKATSDDSLGIIFFGYQGIIYAVEQGASIVNCSWGGSTRSKFGEDVINYASFVKQAAVVAACGNSGTDARFYPAAYEPVLSVANTFYDDEAFANTTFNHSVNLTAPGWSIIAPFQGNDYHAWPGTSASAPLVAGAVALVQSHFPQYTGFQAAERIRVTTDPRIYEVNQDPKYKDRLGTGRLDMHQALIAPSRPSIRQLEISYRGSQQANYSNPGDTIFITGTWVNYLDPADGVVLSLETEAGNEPWITWLDQVEEIPNWRSKEPKYLPQAFSFVLAADAPEDITLSFRLSYEALNSGYQDFEYFSLPLNPSYLDIRDNQIHTTINSTGGWGFNDFLSQNQGLGVQYKNQINSLFEGGLLIGNSGIRISNNIRGQILRDEDFQAIRLVRPYEQTATTGREYRATFSDVGTAFPVGVDITQSALVGDIPLEDDFLIFSYQISNAFNVPIDQIYAGLYADWDINPFLDFGTNQNVTTNLAALDTSSSTVFVYDADNPSSTYYGISLLTELPFHPFIALNDSNFFYSDAEKFTALSHPITYPDSLWGAPDGADVATFVSGGPFDLAPTGSQEISFAILAADSLPALLTHQAAALAKYRCYILGEGPIADFLVSDTLIQPGGSISLADQNAQANQWEWDLGDGTQASGSSITHTYETPGIYLVNLKVSDGTCNANLWQEITVRQVTSADLVATRSWLAYPNPAKDHITFVGQDLPEGPLEVRISNLWGQMLATHPIFVQGSTTVWQLDASTLASGVYHVSLILPESQRILASELISIRR